jgi:L-ribulose-5-phosphate 3-epimerase
MPPIGIMQGRLSPPVEGRTQAFPAGAWEAEFELAREVGLACIEWVYEFGSGDRDPLNTDDQSPIRRLVDRTGVTVSSVCADYFMRCHLVDAGGTEVEAAVTALRRLVARVACLPAQYIVLPFVDESSLSPGALRRLPETLAGVVRVMERDGVELHLETDLRAEALVEVLESVNHPLVRANYDIGNSAALGHDPRIELPALAPWLGSVHVKDRVRYGGTVPLGSGDADLALCCRLIQEAGFPGPYILQTAREASLTERDLAVRNRQQLETWLGQTSPGTH